MPDVESTGWLSRLGKALGGVLIGAVMFFGSFPLLLWNEHNAVATAKSLEEGAAACLDVPADKVDDANEGKLVHVSGDATTAETLKDDLFGVSASALKLARKVEIYQWEERSEKKTEKKVGGSEVTKTYHYHDKKWVAQPIDSSTFSEDDNTHDIPVNVGTMPYQDETKCAKEVKLGAFKLTDSQVGRIGEGEPMKSTTETVAALPAELKSKVKLTSDGTLYQPFKPDTDPANPQIGDVRITFVVLKSPQTISLIAKQFKGSFEPWVSKVGGKSIDDLRNGTLSKDAMFTTLQSENTTRTWLIRLGGFALMAFGIFLVFNPLVVFADVLPIFGNIMGAGIGVFAIIIALPLTLITIAIGWVFVRPMVGIPLLVGAGAILAGGIYLAYRRGAVKKAAKAGAS